MMQAAPAPTSDSDATERGWSFEVVVGAALIVVAGLVAYANSFAVPMLMDDGSAIGNNQSIRHLDSIGAVLSPPSSSTTAGRPLLNLSFALNYAISGTEVWSYHVGNLLIHLLAGLVLFGLARRTLLLPRLRPRFEPHATHLAVVIALLWLLHPLQTEAVTYISQRAESLMGLCYLLTLYAFLRSTATDRPGAWQMLSVLACWGGMATKQVMVTAPIVVVLFDGIFVAGDWWGAVRQRPGYYAGLSAGWLLLAYFMITARVEVHGVGFALGVSWWQYALTEVKVVVSYLQLAAWPSPLVFDYGREMVVNGLAEIWPYALVLAGVLALVISQWRRSRPLFFLMGSVFVLLAPTSSLVPIIHQPMAESRIYLPLAALVALGVIAGYQQFGRWAVLGFSVCAVWFGGLTLLRNGTYRSALVLWTDTAVKRPMNSRAHNNLALVLAEIPDRRAEALAHFEQALRINPNYALAHYNLANELAKDPDRRAEALAHYSKTVGLEPRFTPAHNFLGVELAKIPGRDAEARAHYEQALRVDPDYAEAHNNLAILLARIPGRTAEALTHYARALQLKPDYAEAHSNLASTLLTIPGREGEALQHFARALQLKPDSPEVHYNMATQLAKMPGRASEAIAHYQQALRLRPDFFEARINLANQLARFTGHEGEAEEQYLAALRLEPGRAIAHRQLAAYYLRQGRAADAADQLEAALKLEPTDEEARNALRQLREAMRR